MSKEIDIEHYHQLALQKQKEHRKFLGNLKKKAPKNLDKIALGIHQEVFSEIDCTACANCCNLNIQMQSSVLKKIYLDLLEPFEREVSLNKGRLLLETLETFVLDAGMNSNKTAEFMNIHNNTVQYRLKRINEILGAELTGNRIIPGLTMALALRRMEDH